MKNDKIKVENKLEVGISTTDKERRMNIYKYKEGYSINGVQLKSSFVSDNKVNMNANSNKEEGDEQSESQVNKRVMTNITKHEKILQSIVSDNPMDFLEIAKIAVINQIVDKKVFESGCVPPIRYIVEIVTYLGEVKKIFNCRETPRWFQKNCCHSDAREYSIEIDRDLEEEGELSSASSFVSEEESVKEGDISSRSSKSEKKLQKKPTFEEKIQKNTTFDRNETFNVEKRDPYALIYKFGSFFTCCCSKQSIYIRTIKPEKILGRIDEPWECCHFVLNVIDSNGDEKYRIDASSVQCGIGWRGSIFGKCYEVFFPIFNPGNPSRNLEGADGLIHKRHTACVREDEVENPEAIEVLFPKDCTTEDKFLLICTALTIDYRFYEENPNEVQSEVNVEEG